MVTKMYLLCNKKKIELELCTTFRQRLIGFMFQKKTITTGKIFPKCNSIHTFFMFQKIDVIVTDKNNKILVLYPSLRPNRIIFPQKNGYYIYELPLGICKYYHIGDCFLIEDK